MRELTDIATKVARIIFDTARNKEVLREAGETAKKIIFDRTKAGIGVKNKKRAPLGKLAQSTVRRRRLKDLASDTTPGKSNFTETGRTLDNLEVDVAAQSVTVSVDRRDEKKIKDGSRNFMALTRDEETKIAEVVGDAVAKAIQNKLK